MIRRHLAVWVTHPWAAPAVVIAAAVGLGTVVVAARWGWHPDYHWAGSPDSDVTVATLALMLLAVAPVYGLLAPSRRRPAPGRRPNSGPARPTTAQHGHLPAVVFRAGRAQVAPATRHLTVAGVDAQTLVDLPIVRPGLRRCHPAGVRAGVVARSSPHHPITR